MIWCPMICGKKSAMKLFPFPQKCRQPFRQAGQRIRQGGKDGWKLSEAGWKEVKLDKSK